MTTTVQTKIDASTEKAAKTKTAAPKPKPTQQVNVALKNKQVFTAGTNGARLVVTDADNNNELYTATIGAGASFTIDVASAVTAPKKGKRAAPEPESAHAPAAAPAATTASSAPLESKAKKAKKEPSADKEAAKAAKEAAKADKEAAKAAKEAAKAAKAQKEKRAPSAYNLFIRDEVRRQKEANPALDHKQAFSKAAEVWKAQRDAGASA